MVKNFIYKKIQVFKRFIELGRVVLINYGPLSGKLAVIVDILNTNKSINSWTKRRSKKTRNFFKEIITH